MRKILVALSLLALAACQSPKIHLVTQGYSEGEREKLKNEFSQLGMQVVYSDVTIPQTFPDSSVAINPKFNNLELIKDIDAILQSNGLQVSREFRFSDGNHVYTGENVGVYIRNPETANEYAPPPYLRTQFCKLADGTLALNKNNSAVLEFEFNNDDSDQIITHHGVWKFNANQLSVSFDHFGQTFTLVKEMRETSYGDRPADVFKPKQKKESALGILNCDFMIIYI